MKQIRQIKSICIYECFVMSAEKQNTMQIKTLLADYERKLVLQRYSKNSILNYKSAVKSFLQITEQKFRSPNELGVTEIEKYVFSRLVRISATNSNFLNKLLFPGLP